MVKLTKDNLYQTVDTQYQAHKDSFEAISDYIFRHPEVGGEEIQSATYLTQVLKKYGFSVSNPAVQLPTAGFSFDCITTGFLASAEQVDIIREFIASQKKEGLLVMTDPIMGDEGKLYNGVTEETVENMRRLIGVADVIVPNLTEAEFLTERYRGAEALDRHQAREVVDALLACGPRSVVITSGLEAETGRHVVWGYCHRQGRYFTLPFDFIQVHFPGTGDVFSAVLIGELLAGTGLEQAAQKAMDTVERLVCLDRNEVEKNKGIRIERFLKELDL